MNPIEIAIIICTLILVMALPYLNRYRIFQYCLVIILPFALCLTAWYSLTQSPISKGVVMMLVLFTAGYIYKAITFYKRYLIAKQE